MRQLYNADESVSFTEIAVLARLAREGALSSVQLAELERVSAQAIGTVLGALHRRGLVERSADPSDGRRVITGISAAGVAQLGSREQVVMERLAGVLETLSPDELHRLDAALPVLERIADRL